MIKLFYCLIRFKKELFLLSILLVFSACINAAALGSKKNTAKIGYGVGSVYTSVVDPNLDSENAFALQPFTVIYSDWAIKDMRYWAEFLHHNTHLNASSNKIGQNISRSGFRVSLQKSVRIHKFWAPWFGVGADISQITYTLRHTIDEENFLLKSYSDRKSTALSVVLNASNDWAIERDLTLNAKLEQSIPVFGDLTQLSALLAVLYRY